MSEILRAKTSPRGTAKFVEGIANQYELTTDDSLRVVLHKVLDSDSQVVHEQVEEEFIIDLRYSDELRLSDYLQDAYDVDSGMYLIFSLEEILRDGETIPVSPDTTTDLGTDTKNPTQETEDSGPEPTTQGTITTDKQDVLTDLEFKGSKFEELVRELISEMGYETPKEVAQDFEDKVHFDTYGRKNGELLFVEAKGREELHGVQEIRDFAYRLQQAREMSDSPAEGWVIFTNRFTSDQSSFIDDTDGLRGIDGMELIKMLLEYGVVRLDLEGSNVYLNRLQGAGYNRDTHEFEVKR